MDAIIYAPMSVKCESTMNPDMILEAWALSRPADISSELPDIMKMDVPVNEFMFLTFSVEAPVFIREIICSLRNHVVWARSSRVENLAVWHVIDGLSQKTKREIEELHALMMAERAGRHQDDFRRHLPLGYMTKFSFAMTFRDLVKFIIACEREPFELIQNFGRKLRAAAWVKIDRESAKIFSDLIITKAYKPLALCPVDNTYESGAVGDFVCISTAVTLGLRAQLVRHRALMIKDHFRKFFSYHSMSASMESTLSIQMLMSEEFAYELLRKRSCWIAQGDLWLPILEELEKIFIVDGKSVIPGGVLLPCDTGHCPFRVDNDLRRAGKDPSPPCPQAALLDKKPLTDKEKEKAIGYAIQRQHQTTFWLEMINAL